MTLRIIKTFILFIFPSCFLAQEGVQALSRNINYYYPDLLPAQKAEKNPIVKQKPASLFLPFLDDFYYATTKLYANQNLWQDSSVYINCGLPINPPSIGVATFDGLNKHGIPYNNIPIPNLGASNAADTLCSRDINLYVTANSQTLVPSDNIGLSFYYQPRGYGEVPELIDSLILDLYKPKQNKWQSRVWATRGVNNANIIDTAFKRVFIKIKDTAYFHDGFKFRFRNKATNSGNFDHWHLDYVYLNQGRDSIADTLYNDVTFAHVPTTFLKDYTAMPFQQYQASEMAVTNSVLIKNNYKDALNIFYANRFYDQTNSQVYFYTAQSNNIPPYRTSGYFSNPAFANPVSHPSFTYDFPSPMTDSADFKIKHYIYGSGGSSNDFITANDTVYQFHRFRNYYAFDDGSAEGGYYVNGAAGKMAVKIRVNVTDTLRALRIYFDPSPIGSNEKFNFRIQVYIGIALPTFSLDVGDSLYNPSYIRTGFKEIPEYVLKKPIVLQPGTYFVGIQQQVATGLVVGFDRNNDARTNTFWNAGAGWNQSSIKGAIMLRPVLGAKVPPPVGISEQRLKGQKHYKVFPNPSENYFVISGKDDRLATFQILNTMGQVVMDGHFQSAEQIVNTESLATGVYILRLQENGTLVQQQKILIQK